MTRSAVCTCHWPRRLLALSFVVVLNCAAGVSAALCSLNRCDDIAAQLQELQRREQRQAARLAEQHAAHMHELSAHTIKVEEETARLRQGLRRTTAAAVASCVMWAGVAAAAAMVLNRLELAPPWSAAGLGASDFEVRDFIRTCIREVRRHRRRHQQVCRLPSPPAATGGASSTDAPNGCKSEDNERLQQGSGGIAAAVQAQQPPPPPDASASAGAYMAVEVSLMTATAGEPLGYTNTRVGQLVVRGPDWAAKDGDDDGGAGHLGVVESVVSAGAAAGVQTVRVRWLKTGVETEAQLHGGKPAGCRTFCVAVVDIAAY